MNIITGPRAPEPEGNSCHLAPAQLEALVNFMDEHRDLARGELRKYEDRAYARQLWIGLVKILNSIEGSKKSLVQWQRVWTDKKYLTKMLALSTAKAKANGEPVAELTYIDKKIIEITVGDQNLSQSIKSNPSESASENDSSGSDSNEDDEKEVKIKPEIVHVVCKSPEPKISVVSKPSEHKPSAAPVKYPFLRIVPAESVPQRVKRAIKTTTKTNTTVEKTEEAIQKLLQFEEQKIRNEEKKNAELSLIRISVQEMCSLMKEFVSKYGNNNSY